MMFFDSLRCAKGDRDCRKFNDLMLSIAAGVLNNVIGFQLHYKPQELMVSCVAD